MRAFKEHLQRKNIQLDQADFEILIDEAYEWDNKGIQKWNMIKSITQYLMEERRLDPKGDAYKIFMRKAKLKNSNYHYYKDYKAYYKLEQEERCRSRQLGRSADDE